MTTDAPVCTSQQHRTQGIARHENAVVECQVDAFPPQVTFSWRFNGSTEGDSYPVEGVKTRGTMSYVNYSVNQEQDFGTLLCEAKNDVGKQVEPCVIHLIPAGQFSYLYYFIIFK